MKVLFIGLGCWALAMTAMFCVIGAGVRISRPRLLPVLLAILGLTGAAVLLFRPHEDVFGGQDQGAYLNMAATFARRQQLSFVDPLLEQVPEKDRQTFFYGYRYFPDTKYMCFWVSDVDGARISPWFQPAYPILMSVAASLVSPSAILNVVPLFALFTALALGVLARQLLPHPLAGPAAVCFYLLNPITVWHARSARAEVVASFFLAAACVLVLDAWRNREQAPWFGILLASFCAAAAPFFHITAALVSPFVFAVLFAIGLAGYPVFLVALSGVLAGLAVMIGQTRWVTDCYHLSRFLSPVWKNPTVTLLALAAVLVLLVSVSFTHKRRREPNPWSRALAHLSSKAYWPTAVLFAVVSVGLLCIAATDVFAATESVTPSDLLTKIRITEMRSVVLGLSLPLAVTALAGWIALVLHPGPGHRIRLTFAVCTFPALMLCGEIPILMYFLRRCLPAMVPVIAVSLAALVSLLPTGKTVWKRTVAVLAITAISLSGVLARPRLYTTTDYRGLIRFLQPYAEAVRSDDGILLCEYSRVAAPFEHLFGIPTLGLDNERRFHYPPAMSAWESIMQNHPDRPAFFMTPYGDPISTRFTFSPVLTGQFVTRFLRSEPRRIPNDLREPELRLSLYRMRLRSVEGNVPSRSRLPYRRSIDEGNMGLKNVLGGRWRSWIVDGYNVDKPATFEIRSRLTSRASSVSEALLFFFSRVETPAPPRVRTDADAVDSKGRWIPLVGDWWVYRLPLDHAVPERLHVQGPPALLMTGINLVTTDRTLSVSLDDPRPDAVRIPLYSRWTRSAAEVLLPLHAGGDSLALLLVNSSRPAENDIPRFSILRKSSDRPLCVRKLRARWTWTAVHLDTPEDADDTAWLRLVTTPPWNPERKGIPTDLGTLVAGIVVLSDETGTATEGR